MLDEIKKLGGFGYLASPYSKFPGGLDAAHYDICMIAGWFIQKGVPVYCPIAHTHPIAKIACIDPFDHSIWLPADEPLMRTASCLIIVMMESWSDSYGISEERKVFKEASKRIFRIHPETFEISEEL